ncbi:MAG: hypothetical protein HC849_05530 [Oscillatoriales cyanobacterium RU_3_3]|nr:hypothetical protein [Oscillatoriales cyanobacterium RU_3_3]
MVIFPFFLLPCCLLPIPSSFFLLPSSFFLLPYLSAFICVNPPLSAVANYQFP